MRLDLPFLPLAVTIERRPFRPVPTLRGLMVLVLGLAIYLATVTLPARRARFARADRQIREQVSLLLRAADEDRAEERRLRTQYEKDIACAEAEAAEAAKPRQARTKPSPIARSPASGFRRLAACPSARPTRPDVARKRSRRTSPPWKRPDPRPKALSHNGKRSPAASATCQRRRTGSASGSRIGSPASKARSGRSIATRQSERLPPPQKPRSTFLRGRAGGSGRMTTRRMLDARPNSAGSRRPYA